MLKGESGPGRLSSVWRADLFFLSFSVSAGATRLTAMHNTKIRRNVVRLRHDPMFPLRISQVCGNILISFVLSSHEKLLLIFGVRELML